MSSTDLNTFIWILPAAFGVITTILLIVWLYLMFAPGPRSDRVAEPQQSPPPPIPPAPVESDETIIDQVAGPASLTIQAGLPNPGTYPLLGSEFRIGRFESAQVQLSLDEKTVSRNHAQVQANPQAGQYSLEDLGSSFGTFIVQPDGSTLPLAQGQPYALTDGTVVQFGQVVRVRFNIPGAAANFSTAPMPSIDNDPNKTQF